MSIENRALNLQNEISYESSGNSPSNFGLLVLCCWVASFTVGLDLIYEFKAYDFIGIVGIYYFRKTLLARLSSRELIAKASRWLVIIVLATSLLSIIRKGSALSLAVIVVRDFRLFTYLAIFLIISGLDLDRRRLRLILFSIGGAAVFQAVLIFLQSREIVPILWPLKERIYTLTFPTGTLGLNHLNSVLYMLIGIAAVGSLVYRGDSMKPVRVLWGTASGVLMIYAMLLGEARSALVALPLLAVLLGRRFRKMPILLLAAGLGVAIGGALDIDPGEKWRQVWERRVAPKMEKMEGPRTISTLDETRPTIWRNTIKRILERPDYLITGTGFQNFGWLRAGMASAAHNQYLHVLVELGLIGLAVYLALMYGIFRSLSPPEDFRDTEYQWVRILGRAAFIVVLALGFVNESLYPQRAIMGFMGFGLAYFAIAGHPGWNPDSGAPDDSNVENGAHSIMPAQGEIQ